MALSPNTVFEVRLLGNVYNGGGFNDRLPGVSVDYSQQDSAQETFTDLTCSEDSTIIESVIGGFTEEMTGNILQIYDGTNFVLQKPTTSSSAEA